MLGQREVSEWDLLAGSDTTVAIFKCQHGAALVHDQPHQHKPIGCAQFQQVRSSSIEEPIRTCFVSKVLGTVGDETPTV